MSTSPLKFAKEYAELQSELAIPSAPDLKLLALTEFWGKLKPHASEPAYSNTYVAEFLSHIIKWTSDASLTDCSIDELKRIATVIEEFGEYVKSDSQESLALKLRLVRFRLASLLCYVGDFAAALPVCAWLAGISDLPDEFGDIPPGTDAFHGLRDLSEQYLSVNPKIGGILKDIFDRWVAERSCVNDDRIWCLFVEKDQFGNNGRGRLRLLRGSVESNSNSEHQKKVDTLTFDNQVKTPDDPFVGAAYTAFSAVRQYLTMTQGRRVESAIYNARFSVVDSKQIFTGDSIGLACGLVTYTQLMCKEVMRHERFITSEVAITGSLDQEGQLLAVSTESLSEKVRRAFFSPIKTLVIPEDSLLNAREHLDKLVARYPRRDLQLIGHSSLSKVIEDLNIVRAEKVCPSQFVARKVVHYSRMTKIQVPLLMVLIAVMLAVLFPNSTPWFDDNPKYVRLTGAGFEVLNADSVRLWNKTVDCNALDAGTQWNIGNIDEDQENEIIIVPRAPDTEICTSQSKLYVYDNTGDLLFIRDCVIPSYTLMDAEGENDLRWIPGECDIMMKDSVPIIVTRVLRSHPARVHIRFWTALGDSLGSYINCGYPGRSGIFNPGNRSQRFFSIVVNNLMGCIGLVVLSVDSCSGISPPVSSSGKQIAYSIFI